MKTKNTKTKIRIIKNRPIPPDAVEHIRVGYENYNKFFTEVSERIQKCSRELDEQIQYWKSRNGELGNTLVQLFELKKRLIVHVFASPNNPVMTEFRRELLWEETIQKYGLEQYRDEINSGVFPFITN